MPDEHPFDDAMRDATRRDWEAAKKRPYQMTEKQRESLRMTIAGDIGAGEKVNQSVTRPVATPTPDTERKASISMLRWLLDSRISLAAAALLVVGFTIFFMSISRPITLAMVNPPNKGGTLHLISPWLDDSVAVMVNWKDSSLTLSLKDGGVLTGKLTLPEKGPPGTPALPYQFNLSVRGRSGTGTEITGAGQLLVMPKDSTSTRVNLKPEAILWAKLNLKLQAGGQEDPVYRVFGTP